MAKPILMPQVGQDLTEGKLIEWRIKVGDKVGKGDIVAVVESEKASFEVEAFEAGTVLQLLYGEGDTTEVLAPLAFVGEPGEAVGAGPAPAAAPPAPAHTPAPPVAPPPAAAVPAPPPPPPPVVAAPVPADAKTPDAMASGPKTNGGPRSSPLARRLARDNALDLSALTGSGPQGAIVKRDIEAALSRKDGPAAPAPAIDRPATGPAAGGKALHRVWLRKGSGDPLVLIHGFGADHNAWRVLVSAAALSRPVLALDLPGHGLSPLVGAARWEEIVAGIAATLDEEGVQAADLVGHSLGAALAIAIAETGRITVRSLFLLAPAGLGPDINGAFVAGFLRAETEASLAPWMRLLVADDAVMGAAFIRVTAETRAQAGVMASQDRVAQALFPHGTQAFSVRKALAGLSCTVRIVAGAEDRIIPSHHLAGLPGPIAVNLFPGIGHMPQIEARDPVARLLKEHLASVG